MLEFSPDIVGVRTLTVYKDFFHNIVSFIKNVLKDIMIVAGGPYATSEYSYLLEDKNISIVVIGEGEVVFSELIGAFLENGKKLPDRTKLNGIKGIAFRKDDL